MIEKKNMVIVITIIFLFLIGISLGIIFGNDSNSRKSVSNRSTFVDSNQDIEKDEEVVNDTLNEEEENLEKEKVDKDQYPSLTEETIDKNLVLSCEGGDEVVLWDKPASAGEGARARDRVPCGTYAWAFNQYYNEQDKITFYAINTLDSNVDNAYGWVTEDLVTWRD